MEILALIAFLLTLVIVGILILSRFRAHDVRQMTNPNQAYGQFQPTAAPRSNGGPRVSRGGIVYTEINGQEGIEVTGSTTVTGLGLNTLKPSAVNNDDPGL